VKHLANLLDSLRMIKANRVEGMLKQYCQSQEMLSLYTCIIFAVRFLQGNSWGYSQLFMHEALDQEIVQGLKVVINLLVMVW
jgi:hypothetical protein